MKKINWNIRFKNPVFLAQLVLAVLTPILAYAGLTMQDLTTWETLGQLLVDAVMNPYVLGLIGLSLWNAVNDPTTTGVTDSAQANTYKQTNALK